MIADDSLPDDVETLKRLVRAGEADLARARAEASSAAALIAHLRLPIEKMRREIYGPRRGSQGRALEQLGGGLGGNQDPAPPGDPPPREGAAPARGTTGAPRLTRAGPSRATLPGH